MEFKQLGRYEILSELGQGAMGVVYKAVDPLIDRTVAIKTINLNLSKDELVDFEERFNREAKSAGRLSHPNIVTIYDVGRADHVAFMAMEYLEGRELKEIVASGEVLQPERISEIIAQVADGLAYAHEHGIVHRDIKPANIMVLRNGSVKITDFGIAKMSSGSRTQIGIILGSPKYMSPEQVAGKPVDGRSDIFSLGAVLYELLTGKPAFGGEDNTLTSIMYRILNEIPSPPASVNPTIPGSFDHIVARALAKEPEMRYQSAREMANDLKNYKNLTASALPPSADLSRNTSAAYAGRKHSVNDGDATVVLDARQVMPAPSWRGRTMLASASAVVLLVVIAAALLFNSSRETTTTAHQDKKPVTDTAVSTPIEQPPPSSATENKASAKRSQEKAKPVAPASSQDKVKPVVSASSQATLDFRVLPWGEVFIDGNSQGASPPLKELKLSSGKHHIEIKNSSFPPYRKTVNLEAGESTTIQHKFDKGVFE